MCLTWAWSSLSCGALCCVKLNWGGWEGLKCLHISIESLLLVLTTHPIYQKVTKEILQSKRLPSANGTSVNNNRSLLNSSVNEDKKSEWWSPLCNWTFFVFPQSARWRGQIETEQKQLKIVFSAFKSFFSSCYVSKSVTYPISLHRHRKAKKKNLWGLKLVWVMLLWCSEVWGQLLFFFHPHRVQSLSFVFITFPLICVLVTFVLLKG